MHIHILGIGGTFMGSLALLAQEAGHHVTGVDAQLYPPMSDLLAAHAIDVAEGYTPEHVPANADQFVIGNALSRGNPAVEAVLDSGRPYTSGPQWLAEQVLPGRWVIAVAGTHGKTTTASLVAWILEAAGESPGFLIGGVPENFGRSARLGTGPCFVIEADEYDTAFFDKRAKLVHYRPSVFLLNNLEFDHADIYPDLAAIQRQFHHAIRTVPGRGRVVVNRDDPALTAVLAQGVWSPVVGFGTTPGRGDWGLGEALAGALAIVAPDEQVFRGPWPLPGAHNARNALAAVAAAAESGVAPDTAVAALGPFQGVKRRLQARTVPEDIVIYDDFAHHPTAIQATLEALRPQVPAGHLVAVLEPRSNTMRLGYHREALPGALAAADAVHLYRPVDLPWDPAAVFAESHRALQIWSDAEAMADYLTGHLKPGDRVVIMSNGGFGGLPERLATALQERSRG